MNKILAAISVGLIVESIIKDKLDKNNRLHDPSKLMINKKKKKK